MSPPVPLSPPPADWIWQTCLTWWLLLQRMGRGTKLLCVYELKKKVCVLLDKVVPGWWLLIEGLLFPPHNLPESEEGCPTVLPVVLSPWQMSSRDMPKMYNWWMGRQRGETAPLLNPDMYIYQDRKDRTEFMMIFIDYDQQYLFLFSFLIFSGLIKFLCF